MNRLLARLERGLLGKLAIENLTAFLAGGMALVYVLGMLKPAFLDALVLDPSAVLHGQVWRLVTYLFLPPTTSHPVWFFLSLYVLWMMGSGLESEWGAFKLNAFWLGGMAFTTVAAIVSGPVGNVYLIESLVLAFATVFPNYEMLLFFFLPVRMKVLGWLTALFLAYQTFAGGLGTRAAVLAAVANYLLFFSDHLFIRSRGHHPYVRRQDSIRPPAPTAGEMGARVCALCGAREDDGADIRVCSCEKCGTPRTLCLPHAREH